MLHLQFPNVDYAPDIRCPVFIVHGTQDEVVPFWHGEELFLALEQPWRAKPFWVDGAGVSAIKFISYTVFIILQHCSTIIHWLIYNMFTLVA